ncbi:hypothetical protein MMC11_007437 [Xylographa trunciseda]|nr:hypothetical protein [Xylographa trunciseda]
MSSQNVDGDWETDSAVSSDSAFSFESAVSSESDMYHSPDWGKLWLVGPKEWFRATKGYTQYKDEDKGDLASANIRKEFERLQNNPELFPSKEFGEQMFGAVHDMCERLEISLVHFADLKDKNFNLFEEEVEEVKAAYWPTFQAGRNPWHQFLHNGAPGHRVIPKQASNTESMQIIPPGGLNILQTWQTEIEDVLRTFDDNLRVHRIPSHIVGDKRSYLAVTGNVRVMGTFADANGAPITVPESSSFLRYDSTSSKMPLTHLSQDFEAIEERAGHFRYGNNYVCVREGRGSQGKDPVAKAQRNPLLG